MLSESKDFELVGGNPSFDLDLGSWEEMVTNDTTSKKTTNDNNKPLSSSKINKRKSPVRQSADPQPQPFAGGQQMPQHYLYQQPSYPQPSEAHSFGLPHPSSGYYHSYPNSSSYSRYPHSGEAYPYHMPSYGPYPSHPNAPPPWSSPKPYITEKQNDTSKKPQQQQQQQLNQPRRSPEKASIGQKRSTPPEANITNTTTPEKDLTLGSIFRSPPTIDMIDGSCTKKPRRSPLFGSATTTPNFGLYGSFMDTPGGTLDDTDVFSPMGPSFPKCFEDEGTPFTLGGDVIEVHGDEPDIQFDPKLSLHPSPMPTPTAEVKKPPSRPAIHQRPAGMGSSSYYPYMTDDSMVGSGRPHGYYPYPSYPYSYGYHPSYRPHQISQEAPKNSRIQSTSSNKNGTKPNSLQTKNNGLKAAPLGSSKGNKQKVKKQQWKDPAETAPAPVRLELGNVGMKIGETRKGLEGINSMIRGGSTSSSQPIASYREVTSTPMKVPASTPRTAAKQGASTLGPRSYPPSTKSKYSTIPAQNAKHSSTPSSQQMNNRLPLQTPGPNISAAGKENATPKNKRQKCNCKKSKCLKLYCECFAGEQYCDGCNCNDCKNLPAFESIRAKAIKDTKAKNKDAFKKRIIAGSTPREGSPTIMGCRCKKSACLKKYCECFQVGAMCGTKCKCIDCLNYVGSQALIDKRRKIKDHKGAEFAMKSADDAWKGRSAPPSTRGNQPPQQPRNQPPPSSSRPHPVNYKKGQSQIPPYIQPSPSHQGPAGSVPHQYPPPSYMAPYPSMGYNQPTAVTPGYGSTGKQTQQTHNARPPQPPPPPPPPPPKHTLPLQQQKPALVTPQVRPARKRPVEEDKGNVTKSAGEEKEGASNAAATDNIEKESFNNERLEDKQKHQEPPGKNELKMSTTKESKEGKEKPHHTPISQKEKAPTQVH